MFRKLSRNQFFCINKNQLRLQRQRPYKNQYRLNSQYEIPSYFRFYQKLQDESSSLFNKISVDTKIEQLEFPYIEIQDAEYTYNMITKKKKQGLKKRRKRRYGKQIDLQIGKAINKCVKIEDVNKKNQDQNEEVEQNKQSSNKNKE